MTSKCGKNKKVAHEAIADCVTDVLACSAVATDRVSTKTKNERAIQGRLSAIIVEKLSCLLEQTGWKP